MSYRMGLKSTPPEIKAKFGLFPAEEKAYSLPPALSYTGIFDEVDDQNPTNTCVIHGCVGILEAFVFKHHGVRIEISRRAMYRKLKEVFEHGEFVDNGASVGEGLQTYAQFGYVRESDWPWDPANLFEPVPENLWRNDYPLAGFDAVPIDAASFASAIFHRGPIIIGGPWMNEWMEPGAGGDLSASAFDIAGGHCTVLTAYDFTHTDALWKSHGAFYDRNSWSAGWAHNGYCWMPISVIDDEKQAPWEAYTVRLP